MKTKIIVRTRTPQEEIEIVKKECKPIVDCNAVQDSAIKIIKIFEDVLYKNNMQIPDEHRLGEEDEACIFGLTYYDIENKVKEVLQDLIIRGQQ